MTLAKQYRESYLGPGDVALLCEGDLIGYEAGILREWTSQKLGPKPLVDVWPCGTAHAIHGMSDAIGRSRPVVVIEDRDFRDPAAARKHCEDVRKDRERRGAKVLAWQTWTRNEVENYLLEPQILHPIMASWFDCHEEDSQAALSEVLECSAVFQAVQYALYRARQGWEEQTEPASLLRDQLDCKPQWDGSGLKLRAPDPASVLDRLKINAQRWSARVVSGTQTLEPFRGECLVADFQSRYEEWKNMARGRNEWRVDWSGKEVLQWLRRCLSSRFTWRNPDSGVRQRIAWSELKSADASALDRRIENDMRPHFVRRFLEYLSQTQQHEIISEWQEILDAVRSR